MAAVVVMILASVDHVESANPERYRGGKQQNPRIERAANRDPGCSWSNAKGESEKQMRPARESLAVGIKKDHRQRHRRKHQRAPVQQPSRNNLYRARKHTEAAPN